MKIIITIIILFLFFIYYINLNKNILFYSSNDINTILKDDNYNYFTNMSNNNLEIRNITNKDEYLNNIKFNFYNFSFLDKIILIYNINKAHNIINKLFYPGFIGHKLDKIPWLIACSNNNNYEFGFPHTRNNIIILNIKNLRNKNLYRTLIHERIHIYQKLFPKDINEFLKKYNFKKISKKTKLDRINPDTDGYLYSKDNIIYECKIHNNQLKCTQDNIIYEHPYEYMAYMIVNNI